ncbi:hypothetical protein DERP_001296 [Dermatophagoides pteronyssinus]|uniref:Uncharacterized protein n=1 Tax=Dermatophagoides pteronyssinus TaxID=6956 RepID=A0ABQ8JE21_DERPT|nr:hypothetical protein DERP_001296 [Dermatophagoides pteronyssinus]
MVPLVSFLAALRILTEAQICNNGEGKIVFEKVSTFQSTPGELLSNDSQYEIITRTNVPPLKVLEECFHQCLEDRVKKIGTCSRFDFLPGKRMTEDRQSNVRKRTPKNVGEIKGKFLAQYDQSSCVLYNQANGTINWDDVSNNHGSVWQFDKVCLSSQHINKNCPNRPFVFEKISSFKLIDEKHGKEIIVQNRNECENKCLIERDFTCRSASFMTTTNKCHLNPSNRHVSSSEFQSDVQYEYLENMCLKNNEMCKWRILIIENQKQLDSKFEKHSILTSSMNNCSTSCLESLDRYGFVCRSFMFDEPSEQCILYDEDPANLAGNSTESEMNFITSNGNLYRVLCSADDKDKELDNKTLECYRHKRLRGRHQMEMYTRNFYDCLTGCLSKFGRNCRSIEYSFVQQICRFSTLSVVGPISPVDSDALIDDELFDYYQFKWSDELNNQSYNGTNGVQDSIETSYSQPGNYKNFILPADRARDRDHHRGGFVRPSSSTSPQQTNGRIHPTPTYTFNIEQKQQPEIDGYDRVNDIHPMSEPAKPDYDLIKPNQRYPTINVNKPQLGPNYVINQQSAQPDFRTFDDSRTPSNGIQANQIYPGTSKPTDNLPVFNIPQQREFESTTYSPKHTNNDKAHIPFDPRLFPNQPMPNHPNIVDVNIQPSIYNEIYPSSTYIHQHPHSSDYKTPTLNQIGSDRSQLPFQSNGASSYRVLSTYGGNIHSSQPGYDVRSSTDMYRNQIAYPSPTYTYHIEQRRLPADEILKNNDPSQPNNEQPVQSQIYSVPSNTHTEIYTIQQQRLLHQNRTGSRIPLTPPSRSHQQSTYDHQTIDNSATFNQSTMTPNEFKQRISMYYPGQTFQTHSYDGYSIPRIQNNGIISGGHPIANTYTNYTSYIPYTGHSPYIHKNPTVPGISSSSNREHYNFPAQKNYDRYGHLSPGSTKGSIKGQNSITSSGCDSELTMPIVSFQKMGLSSRLKSKHIYKVARAERLEECERYCMETKDFICKSFNFRPFFPDNCELSSVDTKKFKLDDSNHFEHNTQFDYYERKENQPNTSGNGLDCFEVLQNCSPDGMELKLKTPDGFYGRIYTYGFYDSCFFDGNGGTTSVLKISKPNGFPRCGTQQINPDAMTNIVVVQFNDYVQTSRDKKYNLTCYISGPGEAVVTSNYLDTKTDGRHPMQIEHLPAQNVLTSNIVLRILYRGTPTNTIVVGDLLTFRLEARNQYRFNGYYNDIFATNVIAKDPYTGRQVLLIDSRGCPVDLYVFPELHKTPDGALEAEFYAFKIPDSNFLVFQATVRTCKGPCEPVICKEKSRGGAGISSGSSSVKGGVVSNSYMDFPSWGRKRRSILNITAEQLQKRLKPKKSSNKNSQQQQTNQEEEEVHELLRVYLSQEDIPEPEMLQRPSSMEQPTIPSPAIATNKMCIDKTAYFILLIFTIMFFVLFIIILPYCMLAKWMKSHYDDEEIKNKRIAMEHYGVGGWMSNGWQRMSSLFKMRRHSRPCVTSPPMKPIILNGLYGHHQLQRTYQTSSPSASLTNDSIYSNLNICNGRTPNIERSRSLQSLMVNKDQINKTTIAVNYD